MLHLAMKAFYPAKPPFPLLHVDTTWKFREMIEFRDAMARELGLELLVHINEEGVARGHQPVRLTARRCTPQVMKTEALKQALDKYGFDAAFGGARRDEEKSRAKERIFSFRIGQPRLGPEEPAPRALAALQHPHATRARAIRVFPLSNWTELDIWQYIHAGEHPDRAALLRRASGRWWSATAR